MTTTLAPTPTARTISATDICNHDAGWCRTCRTMRTVTSPQDTCPECGTWMTTRPVTDCTCLEDTNRTIAHAVAPVLGRRFAVVSSTRKHSTIWITAARLMADPYHTISPAGLAEQRWYIDGPTITVTARTLIDDTATTWTITPTGSELNDAEFAQIVHDWDL